MVGWVDGIFASLTYLSALVATLRAGSRALYIINHGKIGVMDGPLILRPNSSGNETYSSPLWELSFGFQQAVRLAISPWTLEPQKISVTNQVQEQQKEEPEPYSLSAFPSSLHSSTLRREDDDQALDQQIDQIIAENRWTYKWKKAYNKLPAVPGKISIKAVSNMATDNLASARRYFTKFVNLAWARTGNLDSDDQEEAWGQRKVPWDFQSLLTSHISMAYQQNATQGEMRVTAYAPRTFSDLRSHFGLSEEDFQNSLLESGPFVSFQSNSKGAARVGGVFFFTRDGAYMVKTIKSEEARTLLAMLPRYHKYMRRNGRRSLLTRFCGMYGVTLPGQKGKERVFVVMNSVFPAEASQFISERFDLKGSTVGRECSDEEKERKGPNAILKDLDLAREVVLVRSLQPQPSRSLRYGLNIGSVMKSSLLAQLRRDVQLLAQCGVMDYSLLVGVVDMDLHLIDGESMRAMGLSEEQEFLMNVAKRKDKMPKWQRILLSTVIAPIWIASAPPVFAARQVWSSAERYLSCILTLPLPYYGAGICGVDGGGLSVLKGTRNGHRAIYYLGLIDFLQPWTTRKVLERRIKGMAGQNVHKISCVPPDEYASRFLDFIDANTS